MEMQKHFGLWNATDYCPQDTNLFMCLFTNQFQHSQMPILFFAIAFETVVTFYRLSH